MPFFRPVHIDNPRPSRISMARTVVTAPYRARFRTPSDKRRRPAKAATQRRIILLRASVSQRNT
jgi:hypothetical protein